MNPCERPGTPATGDDVSPGLARCDRALLETSGCSFVRCKPLVLCTRPDLPPPAISMFLLAGVSEGPLAAMHRGDAAAILGIRRGVRAWERGGKT